MQKLKILALSTLAIILSATALAQQTTVWELRWNFYNFRHQGLMILTDNNTGILHVRVFDRTNGKLAQDVFENVEAQTTFDGTLLVCSSPRIVKGGGTYAADRFKISDNGMMLMMDASGSWSYEVSLRQITSAKDMDALKEKYGL